MADKHSRRSDCPEKDLFLADLQLSARSLFRCLGLEAALFSGARSTSRPQRPGWFSIAKEPLNVLYGEV
ncbi:MAG: hypothetical protein VXZ01_04055 [Pseudomonadota bacterium]|nr:hypothetical protein [Pseudomonadota bacterium]